MIVSDAFLSLREISRRLGVPPSSIAYYRDKFSMFIPQAAGRGKRRFYPPQALEIFERIRKMYEQGVSSEQIDHDLSSNYQDLFPHGRGHDRGLFQPENGGARVPELMDRLCQALEAQSRLVAELASVREDLSDLRSRREQDGERVQARITELAAELADLRSQNSDLKRLLSDGQRRSDPAGADPAGADPAAGGALRPPRGYLGRPLVIRSAAGEYLGVMGKGSRHFSLGDLAGLIDDLAGPARTVNMSWGGKGRTWRLTVLVRDGGQARRRRVVLDTEGTLTPNKNEVTRIKAMTIDGENVPQALILGLFRQVRDLFSGQPGC
ncbi:MAG: MerR family transcriptional regulator [Desulfovibrionaceae bacterium]|nr:MerR family transcriptional regulator [Desulfovibrionaceae bacterium]